MNVNDLPVELLTCIFVKFEPDFWFSCLRRVCTHWKNAIYVICQTIHTVNFSSGDDYTIMLSNRTKFKINMADLNDSKKHNLLSNIMLNCGDRLVQFSIGNITFSDFKLFCFSFYSHFKIVVMLHCTTYT